MIFSTKKIFIKIQRVYIIICFTDNVDREQGEFLNSLINDDSPQRENENVQGSSVVISNTSLSNCKCCLEKDGELRKLQIRTSKLEKLFEKCEKSRIALQKKLNAARQRVRRLEEQVGSDSLNESLRKVLNDDQIALLTKGYKKIPKWCTKTLLNGFKLRFACGTSGYETILKLKLPFPCVRTLSKKMENLKFRPGAIIDEIFEFLRIKINSFEKDLYKDCMIVLDEMSITPGNFYDVSTNTFLGLVTLPGHDQTETATHAQVIMIAGLGARWKQIVRFDFTGDSVNGRIFKQIIDEIIIKVKGTQCNIGHGPSQSSDVGCVQY